MSYGIKLVLAELGVGFGGRSVRLVDPVSMVCRSPKYLEWVEEMRQLEEAAHRQMIAQVYTLRCDAGTAASDFQIRRHLKNQMPKFRLDRSRGRKPWH